jgi:L-rhamnose isomerase
MNNSTTKQITERYAFATERYATVGVDTEATIKTLQSIPISLHCWQGDDVGGFETPDAELSGGGIQATGNYPGKARTTDELRADLDKALSLIPGTHRLNLHAIYGDFGGNIVERHKILPEHFATWIDWATSKNMGMDFNPTIYAQQRR